MPALVFKLEFQGGAFAWMDPGSKSPSESLEMQKTETRSSGREAIEAAPSAFESYGIDSGDRRRGRSTAEAFLAGLTIHDVFGFVARVTN